MVFVAPRCADLLFVIIAVYCSLIQIQHPRRVLSGLDRVPLLDLVADILRLFLQDIDVLNDVFPLGVNVLH